MKLFFLFFALGFSLFDPAFADADVDALYNKICGTCHGNDGNGRGRAGANLSPPATDFTDPSFGNRLGLREIKQVIQVGKPGTAMVGYGRRLSSRQITALAEKVLGFGKHVLVAAPVPKQPQQKHSEGQALYIKHCSACHGDNGNTAVWAKNGLNPPPRNFTTSQAREELSLERMITSVTHGRPGTAMMSFKSRLSAVEIESVVGFIRSRFMLLGNDTSLSPIVSKEHSVHVSTQGVSAPFPGNLVGNVQRGGQFYMQNCYVCHGREGDGKGPRASFNYPRPRNFTSQDTAANFSRAKLFQSIKQGKQGTVMPAWGKVLDDQQLADVAEFVAQAFIEKNELLLSQAKKKH